MKENSGSRKLSLTTLIFGIAALAMRWGLYATALDAKGLLIRNQPLGIAVAVLTIGVLIRIVPASQNQQGSDDSEAFSTASLSAADGSLAAAAGILATVLTAAPAAAGYLASCWKIIGLAAPACLLLAGIARALGKKPFFLLHVVVCLFFVVHIVTRYQLWSGNPQLQDYVFSLLGAMALMFFSFYTAAAEADCGNFRMMLGTGLAAIYLCTVELARSTCPALYLGGILWVLTELGSRKAISE